MIHDLHIPRTMSNNTISDDAFLRALAPHKAILYKVAYTYCRNRDDRRDLMQEMVIQLWRSFGRYDERAGVKFSTWMYRIAMNVAITQYRSHTRQIRDTVPLEEFGLNIAAADALDDTASDNMRALMTLIDGMDELNRALVLLFLDGYDAAEIAEVVGISATNVSTRMTRIKQNLTAQFADATQIRPQPEQPHEQ
jgi:RNA polymerase sigma factor (sigma-70 family)